MVGVLKRVLSLTSQGLGTKVIHTRSQPCQQNQPTIKILDQGLGDFAWLAKSLYVLSKTLLGELNTTHTTPLGEDKWLGLVSPRPCPLLLFLLLI